MWYVIRTMLFFFMTFVFSFLTLTEDLPYQLGMILSMGLFLCFCISFASVWIEDITI